ncbi:MAG: M23 family metallopeptidase [Alphaproteobacteria bacterium]|nr:M23 family metallopeptidase [Alphaproteobacteria bacterium]
MPRRISARFIVLCLCAVLGTALGAGLTGCERYIYGEDPYGRRKEPVKTKPPPAAKALTPEPAAITGEGEVRVQRGDTLFGIARKHNVPLRDLIEANRLRPPYTLLTGSLLVLPRSRTHTVVAGDTLYSISRRYGVDMSLLARVNRLNPPETIRVGQKLSLPAAITASPSGGKTDSSSGAASRQGTSGDSPRKPPSYAPPPPRASSRFHRPLRGQVVGVYGPGKGGLHNDGINILADKGAPVEAAENGVVVYAGNELQGFGNLLLIKHAGGWTSAYAHNDSILVKRGQKVKRGQVVANAGSTGNVSKPQLHFELRRGTRAVDPAKYL